MNRRLNNGEGPRKERDPAWEIRSAIALARRRESRLLRRLGRKALESLSQGEALESRDGQVYLIIQDLKRVQTEIHCLLERLKQATLNPHSERITYPPPPGSDAHFPFSR